MAKTSLLAKRFVELETQIATIEATKRYVQSEFSPGDRIDDNMLLSWKVKAQNLLSMACGKESEHYSQFVQTAAPSAWRTNVTELSQLKAVFSAAKEDYEGGYLNSIRNLIQAELFGNELDQARELLTAGYQTAAAVVAGVVLETTLRQLCSDRTIPVAKLDKMNADLAKAGEYNLLVQKRITALADIRNSAAHGHPDKFKASDVDDMIEYIENFVGEHL